MIEIYSLEGSDKLNEARRIMRYVLIWCSSGSLTLKVDENNYQLGANDVITITSGQIHSISKTSHAKGFVLEFTLDFFCKDDKDIELIFHNGLFCHFAENEVIPVYNFTLINDQLQQILLELSVQPYQYLISIHARIELILVNINRAKVNRGDKVWKPDALFLKFLELVRSSYDMNYSLQQYASLLNTTEAKLNELAKLHTGKTAQNVVHGLIASEAKRLLTYENLTVKEIAHKLGFNDPFYFSNFFKKHTGNSPKSYQGQYRI